MNTDNPRTSISIKIDTNGDAFHDGQETPQYAPGPEVARILREIADRVEWDDEATDQLPLIDYYGNRVGMYEHHATPIQ